MKHSYNCYKAGQTDISLIKVSRGLIRHRHSQIDIYGFGILFRGARTSHTNEEGENFLQ